MPLLLPDYRGHEQNKAAFTVTMDAVEAELGKAEGPYFLSDFSLVDCTWVRIMHGAQTVPPVLS